MFGFVGPKADAAESWDPNSTLDSISAAHAHTHTNTRASKAIQYKILAAHLRGLVSIRCLMCPRCTKLNQIAS